MNWLHYTYIQSLSCKKLTLFITSIYESVLLSYIYGLYDYSTINKKNAANSRIDGSNAMKERCLLSFKSDKVGRRKSLHDSCTL